MLFLLQALLQLLMTYLTMFLFLEDGGSITPICEEGSSCVETWGLVLVSINCSVFGILIYMIFRGYRIERSHQRRKDRLKLVYRSTDEPVVLPAVEQDPPDLNATSGNDRLHYHLFLSHAWSSAQE